VGLSPARRQRVDARLQPVAIDHGDHRLPARVARSRHRVDARGIGEQAVLHREGQELADRGGVHLRELQPREEHALGGQHHLDLLRLGMLSGALPVLAPQLAARVEELPREPLRRVGPLAGGNEDSQLHRCARL
jgi:hypothetical protein